MIMAKIRVWLFVLVLLASYIVIDWAENYFGRQAKAVVREK